MDGQLDLTAGPTHQRKAPIELDGSFVARPGFGDYLKIEGGARLLNLPLARGHVEIFPTGAFNFGARVELALPPQYAAGDPRRASDLRDRLARGLALRQVTSTRRASRS